MYPRRRSIKRVGSVNEAREDWGNDKENLMIFLIMFSVFTTHLIGKNADLVELTSS